MSENDCRALFNAFSLIISIAYYHNKNTSNLSTYLADIHTTKSLDNDILNTFILVNMTKITIIN